MSAYIGHLHAYTGISRWSAWNSYQLMRLFLCFLNNCYPSYWIFFPKRKSLGHIFYWQVSEIKTKSYYSPEIARIKVKFFLLKELLRDLIWLERLSTGPEACLAVNEQNHYLGSSQPQQGSLEFKKFQLVWLGKKATKMQHLTMHLWPQISLTVISLHFLSK